MTRATDQRDILGRGIVALGLTLSDQYQARLLAYLELMIKWNKRCNLTAIRNPQDMVRLHLLDSLAIGDLVNQIAAIGAPRPGGKAPVRMIDVGTGAGLPGIVLAIINPEIQMSLLDANGKKCRFLHQVKIELGLVNTEVIHHRVESYTPDNPYAVVLSRAFARLKDMADNTGHLLADGGCFLAMKGRYPERELAELAPQFLFKKAYPLQIPELDAARCLIEIRPP